MKISGRTGGQKFEEFVYGLDIDNLADAKKVIDAYNKRQEAKKKQQEAKNKKKQQGLTLMLGEFNSLEELQDSDEYDHAELVENIADKLDIDIHYGKDDQYLGYSWDNVGDDETGKQFKERIQNKLKELNLECDTHEECFHD